MRKATPSRAKRTVDQADHLLIEGVNSGPSEPMNAAWRNARRATLAKHVRAQADIDAAGRQAYLNAKAGKGLSPAYDTADEFIDALHQAVQRPTAARRRTKK